MTAARLSMFRKNVFFVVMARIRGAYVVRKLRGPTFFSSVPSVQLSVRARTQTESPTRAKIVKPRPHIPHSVNAKLRSGLFATRSGLSTADVGLL